MRETDDSWWFWCFGALFSDSLYSPALIWAAIGASLTIFTALAGAERKNRHILLRFQPESG
jgi:hypothetical protein